MSTSEILKALHDGDINEDEAKNLIYLIGK